MSYGTSPICFRCLHFYGIERGVGWVCRAYPKNIPTEILINKVDHRLPYKGDKGIQFEPKVGSQ